jgi:hypothetical protein
MTELLKKGVKFVWSEECEKAFHTTTWKTRFGNGRRSPLVTSNAPITDQVVKISQER